MVDPAAKPSKQPVAVIEACRCRLLGRCLPVLRRPQVLPPSQSGLVSLYVVVVFTAFVLLAGLVVDGSQIRHERRRLSDVAAQIARESAQEVVLVAWYKDQQIRLDAARAEAKGRQLLQQFELDGSVAVGAAGSAVTVTVSRQVTPTLAFIAPVTVTASRTATAVASKQEHAFAR